MNEYEGHWICTFTGKKVHYLDPHPNEIDLRDIAHALSLTCRFGGHCNRFYSVAEHSLRVADQLEEQYKLSALLHDAHEAYLHDVPRPIKRDIKGYSAIADTLQAVINIKFDTHMNPGISYYDDVLLATEARDLGLDTTDWAILPPPLDKIIIPIRDMEKVESLFYETATRLIRS